MMRWSSAQLLRTAEFAYAIVALFALTQGPVYRLWNASAALAEKLPAPTIAHAHFATFVAVQIPAVLLWFRRADIGRLRARSNQALILLMAWLGLSVLWSAFARQSMPDYVALVLTTCFGLYLAASFSLREFWWVVSLAMALGVGVSWLSVMRLWDGAVNLQEDYWIGIYGNRNSLAPVTAMAIIAAVGVVLSSPQLRTRRLSLESALTVLFLVALVFFAVVELWNSGSRTSPAALAVAFLVCIGWLVVRRVMIGLRLPAGVNSLSAPLVLAVSAVVLFFVLRVTSGVVTETAAFNGRSGLWVLSWQGVLEKPWHGWGWMAAWKIPQVFFELRTGPTWMATGIESSHSGYFDVLLGGGIPAAIFLLLYLWTSSRCISLLRAIEALPSFFLVVFVLVAATQESFFTGSHFFWALLIATPLVHGVGVMSIDEKNSSERSS